MYTYIILILIAIVFLNYKKKENYGVFSHRAAMNGIQNQTRNSYSFDKLKLHYPINYWTDKPLNVYDTEIKKYHSKRFKKDQIM